MENLKMAVTQIAYARDRANLSTLQRSLIPVLSLGSSLYKFALSLRYYFYHYSLFRKHRLPVPVISVGNLTWGGNGKTPMVEFIALWLADSGISPLILNRGYAGGDEAEMLRRHFLGRSIKVGVGANRAAIAASFFKRCGYFGRRSSNSGEGHDLKQGQHHLSSERINAVILDDGLQHWHLQRDVEIVMVNGLTLWGNCQLLPLGPLREPLTALRRADIAVVHHADLVSEQDLEDITMVMQGIKESLIIVFTRMAPSYFFDVSNINSKVSLQDLHGNVVLCVSAIGSADAFVRAIQKMGSFSVDRLDFSDHHRLQERDIRMIRIKLGELENKFGSKPVVIVTEKDYDRDPEILKRLYPYNVLALHSKLQIMTRKGLTEYSFKKLLREMIKL